MKGKKPTPTEILKLNGNFRRDRNGTRMDEEIITKGNPQRPTVLGKVGLRLWDSLVPHFERWGCICEADTVALTEMCRWYEVYRYSLKQAMTAEDNKMFSRAKEAYVQFDKIASRYGFTPSDRARIKVEGLNEGMMKKMGVVARSRVS